MSGNLEATAAGWRANLAFAERLSAEAQGEYTSKARLRWIALGALASLQMYYGQQLEIIEKMQEEEASKSGLILPATEIVTP